MTIILSPSYIVKSSNYQSISKKLKTIFDHMDQEYKMISEFYDFNCFGCRDNCCSTTFHHKTLVEYLYLIEGFNNIPEKYKNEVERRAFLLHNKQIDRLLIMCPLNFNNQCIAYNHRPMICRLHGIPHELHYPNNNTKIGPGCHKFEAKVTQKTTKRLDRTTLYTKIIDLEMKIRETFYFRKKIKLTITEMLMKRHNLI